MSAIPRRVTEMNYRYAIGKGHISKDRERRLRMKRITRRDVTLERIKSNIELYNDPVGDPRFSYLQNPNVEGILFAG